MSNGAPNVITLSYAKRAAVPGSREYERMRSYASVLNQYHIIVFTRARENFPAFQQNGNLYIYATNSRTKIGMVLKAYRLSRTILKENRQLPYVVSAQDPLISGLLSWLITVFSRNARLHIQMHGDVFSSYFFALSGAGSIKRSVAKFVLRRAKKIRVVSKRIASSLQPLGIAPEKIAIVPIQADLEQFLGVYSEREYADCFPVRFLYVGRLAPEKNLSLLLKAFAQLKGETEVQLTLVGEGPCQPALRQEAAALRIEEQLSWLPWTDQVAALMKQADVFCLSSLHEGFGMVLIEAMATGLPVVTSDVGCAGEMVVDGKEGRVVPVNNLESYVTALREMLSVANRRRFGQAGHTTALATIPQASDYLAAIKSSYII